MGDAVVDETDLAAVFCVRAVETRTTDGSFFDKNQGGSVRLPEKRRFEPSNVQMCVLLQRICSYIFRTNYLLVIKVEHVHIDGIAGGRLHRLRSSSVDRYDKGLTNKNRPDP